MIALPGMCLLFPLLFINLLIIHIIIVVNFIIIIIVVLNTASSTTTTFRIAIYLLENGESDFLASRNGRSYTKSFILVAFYN